MVNKYQLAVDRLAHYSFNMSAPAEPLDTHITEAEAKVSIIIVSVLGTLILLNVFFYLLFKRVTQQKLSGSTKVKDRFSVQHTTETSTQQSQMSPHSRSFFIEDDMQMMFNDNQGGIIASDITEGDTKMISNNTDDQGKETVTNSSPDVNQREGT